MYKKIAKIAFIIFLLSITIFNLLALGKIYLSVRQISNQSILTQELTQQLNFLKEEVLIDTQRTEEELDSQNLSSILQSELESILYNQEVEKAKQSLPDIFTSPINLPDAFNIQQTSTSILIQNAEKVELLNIKYDSDTQSIITKSIAENSEYSLYQLQDFKDYLSNTFTAPFLNNLNALNQKFSEFKSNINQLSPEDKALIADLNLSLETPFALNSKAYSHITKSNQVLLTLEKDLTQNQYSLIDKHEKLIFQSTQWQEYKSNLITYLQNNQLLTTLEQNLQAKIEFIKKQLNNEEFLEYLQTNNLLVSNFIDDNNQFYVSIQKDQQQIVSIKVNKFNSQVFLIVSGVEREINFQDLEFQIAENDLSSKNYLLLGKHGSLTDTIIIANVNNQTQQIKLISLPRDLYIDNRKINSLHVYFGANHLRKKIENLTGLKIENYALIDMYAFVDIVDYLGGIEVTLNKPLRDPSYRTFDNQQWGSLSLSAGTHFVNGRQALRIARSRNSTSDFDRAQRQHLIIQGIKQRVADLSAKDIRVVTQLALLGLDSTETDLSIKDSLSFYRKYRNYEISKSLVLSTANILESTYTGTINSDITDPSQLQNRGAYILLPKNNDWSIIRTYVQGFIRN